MLIKRVIFNKRLLMNIKLSIILALSTASFACAMNLPPKDHPITRFVKDYDGYLHNRTIYSQRKKNLSLKGRNEQKIVLYRQCNDLATFYAHMTKLPDRIQVPFCSAVKNHKQFHEASKTQDEQSRNKYYNIANNCYSIAINEYNKDINTTN